MTPARACAARRVRVLLLLLLALPLVGCQLYWSRPGATYEDFVADHRACVRATGIRTGPDPNVVMVQPDFYRQCLKTKGWVRGEHSSSGTQPGWFRGLEEARLVHVDSVPEQVPWLDSLPCRKPGQAAGLPGYRECQ